ncbi:GTP 3',8-cyclase MoaA [Desulfuromonas sp. AOP6]|uniref:GTP 3',8-cyclase MoaA n=1 Tax=Desulfuromonas sp. AOP6 TaxID=1566351 RepID=UPI001281A56F|nr:GTP 3',8-cyclase MoaA [Desulfuromonas sp. AOP6]BCA79338.1 GTP 3',8-cyclase [Desulfuromonas sp. AOP6]
MKLFDGFHRKVNYLRLSVTDRCNLRCRYCMPAAGVSKLGHNDILSYEALQCVSRAAVSLGIEKIRITGGEPLVRKGLLPFLHELSALPGLKELVLTTNGTLLPELATELKAAGVKRVNISLDSLQPDRFRRITRGGDLARVLAGIAAAEAAGIAVKLNMVVMRGINDDEVVDFAAMAHGKALSVRFIEYMPNIQDAGWQAQIVRGQEILERIGKKFSYQELRRGTLCGPSRDYHLEGASGSIGIITPVSNHFCDSCNRIRVTATGLARSCLFSGEAVNLRPVLLGGDVQAVQQVLLDIVKDKVSGHRLDDEKERGPAFCMSSIGG